MKDSKIFIFEGNQLDGCFSKSKKFYPDNYTEEDIKNSIKKDRIKLGQKYNFSGLKMFQVTQKMEDNDSYEDNKAVVIEDSYLKGDDFFEQEIKADILFITKDYPGIVLSHRMADCPVLIAEDREKGIEMLENLMNKGSFNNTVYYTLYQTYKKDKNYDDAIRVCEKAIEVLGFFSNDRLSKWADYRDKLIIKKEKE